MDKLLGINHEFCMYLTYSTTHSVVIRTVKRRSPSYEIGYMRRLRPTLENTVRLPEVHEILGRTIDHTARAYTALALAHASDREVRCPADLPMLEVPLVVSTTQVELHVSTDTIDAANHNFVAVAGIAGAKTQCTFLRGCGVIEKNRQHELENKTPEQAADLMYMPRPANPSSYYIRVDGLGRDVTLNNEDVYAGIISGDLVGYAYCVPYDAVVVTNIGVEPTNRIQVQASAALGALGWYRMVSDR